MLFRSLLRRIARQRDQWSGLGQYPAGSPAVGHLERVDVRLGKDQALDDPRELVAFFDTDREQRRKPLFDASAYLRHHYKLCKSVSLDGVPRPCEGRVDGRCARIAAAYDGIARLLFDAFLP